MADLTYAKLDAGDSVMTPQKYTRNQILAQRAKDSIKEASDNLFLQTEDSEGGDLEAASKLADEIEKVYNFERDVATAKSLDPNFDDTAKKISSYMNTVRRTYKDPEYLRDPISDPMKHALRQQEDKNRRDFEAYKQALDDMKTKYMVSQSDAVAKAAGW